MALAVIACVSLLTSPSAVAEVPSAPSPLVMAADHGSLGGKALAQPVVGITATSTGLGYWLVARDGGIFAFGDARFHGSTGAIRLNQPIVGMAASPSGRGYRLVAADGGIFAFGDATFHGSTGAMRLNQPIVGMAATPSGNGYWLVASDGGIFAFGDAAFFGSTGAIKLNQPIVGMGSTPSGNGYWLVASDGGIFAFGDAVFRGSTGALRLGRPIVGLASTPTGGGYWLVASDGGIFAFGDAHFHGSGVGVVRAPVVGIATSRAVGGYWVGTSGGGVVALPSGAGASGRAPAGGDTSGGAPAGADTSGGAPAGADTSGGAPAAADGRFATLPPGAALPTGDQCAARVRRSTWEPRPQNSTANHTTPPAISLPGFTPWAGGVDIRSRSYADRVNGNFTGTTDEILQWGACKWGLDEDVVRAVAVNESWWRQSTLGDTTSDATKCPAGYTAPCALSFGLLQVKATAHPGTFPWARDSTAFNVDYALLVRRICYEGWTTWLARTGDGYGPGNEWGCVGSWYSGRWMDTGARSYIDEVKGILAARTWSGARF